ncbi:ribosomal-protein-alanine acetyltransferase [uncultured Clostridium sp.]|nr:ribosomal-protein-alanine acetyltransferase [uncultured Clostridium sp.]
MMKKKFIDMKKEEFESFFNILEKSFPDNERRKYVDQLSLLDKENYRPLIFKEKDEVLAIMATWEFEKFVFIEHLAVDNKLRGKGVGTSLIDNYLKECNKEVFLEVEPPQCEISTKRIKFYEKLNFYLNDFYYLQQPLNEGDLPFELKIMSYDKKIDSKDFEEYKNIIYKEVYGK